MDATIANANKQLDKLLRPLFESRVFLAVLALFFALYAGFLAPALPNGVIRFFDTIVGKLLFIFLIAFVASRNVENSFQVALIVSVIFLITLTVLNNLKAKEAFRNLGVEHFSLMNQMRGIVENMEDANMDKKCQNAVNFCATEGPNEIRGELWGTGMIKLPDGTEGIEVPEKGFAADKCQGYFKTCMGDKKDYSLFPKLEKGAAPNEESCRAVYTKEKCMAEYDIKPANEETCNKFLTLEKDKLKMAHSAEEEQHAADLKKK